MMPVHPSHWPARTSLDPHLDRTHEELSTPASDRDTIPAPPPVSFDGFSFDGGL